MQPELQEQQHAGWTLAVLPQAQARATMLAPKQHKTNKLNTKKHAERQKTNT